MKRTTAFIGALLILGAVSPCHAEEPSSGEAPPEEPRRALHYSAVPADTTGESQHPERLPSRDVRGAPPNLTYAYSADGATAKTAGAHGFAQGLFASGQSSTLGGGATMWWAPIDRLTLILDAQRNLSGNFSPSAAVVGRILGDPQEGWSLGALGKFKVDGFASGPNKDEMESEIELGALVSLNQRALHLDLNAIAGRGTGDDGETDTEGRLRFGYDLGEFVRLGLDGQARVRVSGPKYLPNGRIWDFAAGPQLFVGSGHFYGALTTGPATTGLVSHAVGFTSVLAIGGTT